MAAPFLQTVFILVFLLEQCGTSSSKEAGLDRLVAELEEWSQQQNARIEVLEAEVVARQLLVRPLNDSSPSIFGDGPRRRSYTTQENLNGAADHFWIILCGTVIMLMQAGFALVESGSCRVRNTQNILLKNLTDVCVGTLGWWILGWSFAFSGPVDSDGFKSNFAGSEQFAGHTFLEARSDGQQEPTVNIAKWYIQWAFATTATTIVSAGVAERVLFPGYCIYSLCMTCFMYPIVAAWTRGGGFLAKFNDAGFVDFGGSGFVHLTGGVGALVGACVAGPRKERFLDMLSAKDRVLLPTEPFSPHSIPLTVLGTFILWFGWYGLTCGSTLNMSSIENGYLAAHVAMNSTIAAATGGLVAWFARLAMFRKHDAHGMCNGILGGLVSISAACANIECGSAFVISALGVLLSVGASAGLKALKIDDPVDAVPVHGVCGAWALLAAALFDWGNGFSNAHGAQGFRCVIDAATKTCRSDNLASKLLVSNLLEFCTIVAWVGGLSLLIFLPLRLANLLTASDDQQDCGFDDEKHMPVTAYDLNAAMPHTVI